MTSVKKKILETFFSGILIAFDKIVKVSILKNTYWYYFHNILFLVFILSKL